ncbi:hypothetical protein DN388_03840 [Pseudomonas sp. S12(2018)]|nr:hypothetical protein [Pseudomonas sp. S12(2018)]
MAALMQILAVRSRQVGLIDLTVYRTIIPMLMLVRDRNLYLYRPLLFWRWLHLLRNAEPTL